MSTRDADPASNDVDVAETKQSMGRALDRARTVESWAVHRRHPTHADGRPSRRPPTPVNSCGAPSRNRAGGGSTNSLNRVCSRDEPSNDQVIEPG